MLDGGAILNWIGSLPDPVVPIASIPAAIQELVKGTADANRSGARRRGEPCRDRSSRLWPFLWSDLQ